MTADERVRLRPVHPGDLARMFDLQLDPDSNRMAFTIPRTAEAFDSHWAKALDGVQDSLCSLKELLVYDLGLVAPKRYTFDLESMDGVALCRSDPRPMPIYNAPLTPISPLPPITHSTPLSVPTIVPATSRSRRSSSWPVASAGKWRDGSPSSRWHASRNMLPRRSLVRSATRPVAWSVINVW